MASNIMTITNRIIELHNGIIGNLRRTVDDAVRIGKLLTKQKEVLGHGNFLKWIENDLPFSHDTARNYTLLYKHDNKIRNVRNLNEAYRKIDILERQKRIEKKEYAVKLASEAKKTGFKPEGWNRDAEYEYKKQKAFEEQEPKSKFEDPLKKLFERIMYETKDEGSLDLNDLRSNVAQKGIFCVLEEYIRSFKTDSERLEAIHNLIKKLRLIAIEYHKDT